MIDTFVALDIETTGLSPENDRIIEIGIARYTQGTCKEKYETFVNPGCEISSMINQITGINDHMVEDAPDISKVIGKVVDFVGNGPILGHNINFDYKFIKKAALDAHIPFNTPGIDTYKIAKKILKDVKSYKLEYLCEYFNIETIHHRALADAISAAEIFFRLQDIDNTAIKVYDMIYRPVKIQPATAKQLKYLTDLMEKNKIVYEGNIKDLTKSEASRLIDRIISGSF